MYIYILNRQVHVHDSDMLRVKLVLKKVIHGIDSMST